MADALSSTASNQNNISSKTTPVIFEGKASEYFGIWIVNLLLSIVTLGIYSAWAKVRRKKYFYNNMLIENASFDYHAKPISILKGRIIAVALLLVAAINPILQSLVFLVIFIFLPWLVVRGSIFNARNTSHRGLRFDFIGTVSQAVRVFIGLPLLTIVTLGLAAPYVAHERNQFLVNNHRFGLSQFEMSRVVKQFYKVYLIIIVVPLVLFIIGLIVGGVMRGQELIKAKAASQKQSQITLPSNIAAFSPVNQKSIVLAANDVSISDALNAETPQKVERVYSENATDNVTDSAPIEADINASIDVQNDSQTQIKTEQVIQQESDSNTDMQEKMSEQDLAAREAEMMEEEPAEETLSEEQKMLEWIKNPKMIFGVIAAAAAYLFFIFGFMGYLQARIGNLIWNNTTLDKLSFKSSLRARDFAWLYFSNIVAIMLTFGLATPWAQIRMARYRASKLQIVGDVDFDQFEGDKKAEVKATGEEIADMFDVDLSFG